MKALRCSTPWQPPKWCGHCPWSAGSYVRPALRVLTVVVEFRLFWGAQAGVELAYQLHLFFWQLRGELFKSSVWLPCLLEPINIGLRWVGTCQEYWLPPVLSALRRCMTAASLRPAQAAEGHPGGKRGTKTGRPGNERWGKSEEFGLVTSQAVKVISLTTRGGTAQKEHDEMILVRETTVPFLKRPVCLVTRSPQMWLCLPCKCLWFLPFLQVCLFFIN